MRILLINPKSKVFLPPKNIPIGLAVLSAVLKNEGHNVRIIDMQIQGQSLENSLKWSPDVVGITATTPMIKSSWKIAEYVKSKTNATVVLGGPHPTALAEESISKPQIDFVVKGEGEITFPELCSVLEKKTARTKIKGICFKKGNKNIVNSNRPFIKNLDKIPFPDFDSFPSLDDYTMPQPIISEKVRSVNIVTSRGCPYSCNYCFKGLYGCTWRAHSEKYLTELCSILKYKYKVKEIGIQDDAFNLNRKRLDTLLFSLKKERLDFKWTAVNGIRADLVDKKLLLLMKSAGFYRLGFGIESGSQLILDSIQKNLDISKVKGAISASNKLKIETIGFFMLGNLGETKQTMEETIRFSKSLGLDYAQFTTVVPFPGTKVREIAKREGKILINDWNLYGHNQGMAYFEHGNARKKIIEEMWQKAYRSFYFRPEIIIKHSLNLRNWSNLGHIYNASRHFFFGKNSNESIAD